MSFNGFINSFTNSPIQPSDVSYLAIPFQGSAQNIALEWVFQNPATLYPFCQFISATGSDVGTYSITMPNALYSSTIQSTIVYNQGTSDVTLYNNAGTSIGVCSSGLAYYVGNTSNDTAAGTWDVFLELGAGSSSVTAASLVDPTANGSGEPNAGGLSAYSQYLKINQAIFDYTGTTYAGNASDLGNVVTWKSGSGTYTLAAASSVKNGFITGVQNRSTTGGIINITPSGSDNLNGVNAVLQMQVNESTYLISDGSSNWYTFCYSSNIAYVIQEIGYNLATSGGAITISVTDAAYQIQAFNGTYGAFPYATVLVTLPATLVQQYFINNTSTTNSIQIYVIGESDANFKYTVLPGNRFVGFTDGTHLYNAPNYIANSTIYLSDGSPSSPQLTFTNDTDTGIFRQTSGAYTGAMGITQGGVASMYFDSDLNTTVADLAVPDGATGAPSLTFTNDITSGVYLASSGTYSGEVVLAQGGDDCFYVSNTGNTNVGNLDKVGGSYLDNSISIYSLMRAYG